MIAALALLFTPAVAPVETEIPFFSREPAHEWRADGTRGLWIEGGTGRWYYARFTQPCVNLPSGDPPRFNVSPGDQLDRFSSVSFGNQRCRIDSLTETPKPPRKRLR